MVTTKGTQSGLPPSDWTPQGTGALVPAVAPCAHLPPWGVQMNLGQSRVVSQRRQWHPTPVFLPGESQGWGSLVSCHLRGHTELDTTEAT